MHKRFDHQEIESKWQKEWRESGIYNVGERDKSKEKEYVLVEWPYPSGNLHIGHWYAFAVPDIYVRYRRMQGKQVLFPMGFDAFGLPAENAAIKRNINPREWTESNIEYMKGQLASMGNAFSWDKTTSSTDPEYFKWTQWMFAEFFKNDIAYRGEGVVNWCPGCNTVIANEQVLGNGTCERCDSVIEKKKMPQWMIKITDFADALIDDLVEVDWPEHIKEAQKNWIGRSEGAEIDFVFNLPSQIKQIAFASNNQGKLKRIKKLLDAAGLDVEVKTPIELGIQDFDVVEDQETLEKNSRKKALALSKLVDLPVLSDDTGFFVSNEEIDPVKVKRNALSGKNEKDLTIEEISDLMQDYYKNIANKYDGKIDAEWRNCLTLITADGTEKQITALRPVILTNESHGEVDPHLPLRGLYISKVTNKYVLEQTEDDENLELEPIRNALKNLLSNAITVFTTRPDTLFGATYLVLAPEHELVQTHKNYILNWSEVEAYIGASKQKAEQDRLDNTKEKTGVKLEGITATNPVSGEEIPVYIADYVLAGYGTGAIMAVPAHDERDFAFAKKFGLPIKAVAQPSDLILKRNTAMESVSGNLKNLEVVFAEECWTGTGELINSGKFTGLSSEEAKIKITEKVGGRMTKTYRLRDWSIGRQRYWGVPIPIVYDPAGKAHPIPKEHLPWKLPEDVDFTPTGVPPLAKSVELKKRTEAIFGAGWTPEVETMDTFVDSSWYFLRYLDNQNGETLASVASQHDWMSVDTYFGGAEHTTMHLLYSRFWQKALYKLGLVTHKEPYKKRINRGMILGPNGNKMSKSKGNVIDPDEQVKLVGADTVKMYLAFMGPYQGANYPWDLGGVAGLRRFLERVNGLSEHVTENEPKSITNALHKTIKKVADDIVDYKFNTAVSALMIFLNQAEKEGIGKESYNSFLQILAPFAPHLTEELWHEAGNSGSVHTAEFPAYDPTLAKDESVTIGVQINGKMRGEATVSPEASESDVLVVAKQDTNVAKYLENTEITKIIYVPGRIINLIIK